MKRYVSMVFLLISFNLHSQNTLVPDAIYGVNEITFYGYDFNHFKLAEGKRLNDDIVAYVYSWIGYMSEKITPEQLTRSLKKQNVIFDFDYTIDIAKGLHSPDLVFPVEYRIPKDSVQSIVNRYKVDEKEGVGFVVIVECFYKNKESASAYFTFFDIESKKVIFSEHVKDKTNTRVVYGMTNFWGCRLKNTFDKYLRSYRENY